jgi:hypothetical protein
MVGQHSLSYNFLNTLEYRYIFSNKSSVFVGGRAFGFEYTHMLFKNQRDPKSEFGKTAYSMPLVMGDFWIGYGKSFGNNRIDGKLSYTLREEYRLFSQSHYQFDAPHPPIYDYTYNATNLIGIGVRYIYCVGKYFRIGSSIRFRLHTSSLGNSIKTRQTAYGEIREVESGRISMGWNPLIIGFEF